MFRFMIVLPIELRHFIKEEEGVKSEKEYHISFYHFYLNGLPLKLR